MLTDTGGTIRTEGPHCRCCKSTEARCAWNYGSCCPNCTHWIRYDAAGDEIKSDMAGGRSRLPVEHGTDRGYYQHRVRHESACLRCRAAHSLRTLEQRRAS